MRIALVSQQNPATNLREYVDNANWGEILIPANALIISQPLAFGALDRLDNAFAIIEFGVSQRKANSSQ